MADLNDPIPLPPGWDCKYDARTSRYYFVNYYTKTTTWEDPRLRHASLPTHGTPIHQRVSSAIGEFIPLQEMSKSGASPLTSRNHAATNGRMQETSTVTQDTEQIVSKISAMFPTVTETHIRLLLKKYMKSIFPTADATLILDILSNNDKNIQKATDILLGMGYEKKDIKAQKNQQKKSEEEKVAAEEEVAVKKNKTPTIKTTEEKKEIKAKLQQDHPNIPEQIINLALDSVHYDSDRANQILQIMEQEDSKSEQKSDVVDTVEEIVTVEVKDNLVETSMPEIVKTPEIESPNIVTMKNDTNNKSWRSRIKIGNFNLKNTKEVVNGESQKEYTSNCIIQPIGPNNEFQRGPNPDLLLPDYTTWNGANPSLLSGRNTSLAKGPNKGLLQSKTYQAKGPNNDLRKGPIFGLAKGSIYSQIKSMLCETRAN